MQKLILASSSPRRRELLRSSGLSFRVVEPRVSEEPQPGTPEKGPEAVVVELAVRKAAEVRARLGRRAGRAWIVGADTEVEKDGRVLGKPSSALEAQRMLESLQGGEHRVHTGLAVFVPGNERAHTALATTRVVFRGLTDAEIDWYVGSGEWRGAAGAYRIQQRAALFVQSIEGSYSNVVGLPLGAFYGILTAHGFTFR